MNILLISPSQKNVYGKIGTISQPNMGLAYIGTVLKKRGHDILMLDIDYSKMNDNKFYDLIYKQEMVCITATTPIIKNALSIAKLIKELKSDITIVLGGIHATIETDYSLYSDIDYIVKGEGEKAILRIINERPQQKIIREPLIDNIDDLPFIDRNMFSSEQYQYPDTIHKKVFPMITSRGCFGQCTFCQTKNIYGSRIRFRSPDSVVDEIDSLIEMGAKEIHIWDDNFAADKKRVFEIRDKMHDRKLLPLISFPNGLRIETALDMEVLKAIREMGGYSISFGIESGNQRILDSVKKGITLNNIRRAMNNAKSAGFEIWGFFILGFPLDGLVTMQETIDFAKSLPIDVAKFHILKPYPGSLIHEEMKNAGLIESFNYDDYGIHTFPVHHTRFVSAQEIYVIHKKAYRAFYFRPKVILNQLRLIKSFHRLKEKIKYAFKIFN